MGQSQVETVILREISWLVFGQGCDKAGEKNERENE